MVSPSALAVFRLTTNSQNRKLGGIRALEDAAGIDADPMKLVCEISSIAHQFSTPPMVWFADGVRGATE